MTLRSATLLLLFLSGCGEPPSPPDPRAYVDSLGLMPVQEIYRAKNSGVIRESAWLVRDSAAWNALWTRITDRNFNRPPQPRVDFEREMLVVVAAGLGSSMQPTLEFAGYDEPDPRTRRVAFLLTQSRNCPIPTDQATLLIVGRVPADGREVRFRWIHGFWC